MAYLLCARYRVRTIHAELCSPKEISHLTNLRVGETDLLYSEASVGAPRREMPVLMPIIPENKKSVHFSRRDSL